MFGIDLLVLRKIPDPTSLIGRLIITVSSLVMIIFKDK